MIAALKMLSGVGSLLASPVNSMADGMTSWALRGRSPVETGGHRPVETLPSYAQRHPCQIMRWQDLRVGVRYISVHVRECDMRTFVYKKTFAGAFAGPARAGGANPSDPYRAMEFTIHLNGWTPWPFALSNASVIYWLGDGQPCTYSSIGYMVGATSVPGQHELLVPLASWESDPAVLADWGEMIDWSHLAERLPADR